MNILWGVILTILSSLAYFGQLITAFWPRTAEKLTLTEKETEVDAAFYADMRGEAWWDVFTLWTLLAAGVLLILNHPLWSYFGLVGGGIYLYFAGRGIVARRVMRQRGINVGRPETLKVACTALAIWGLAAVITIIMAISALTLS